MDEDEILAAAQRIQREATALAEAGDELLVGPAIQIRRLAEWIEEIMAISKGEVPPQRRSAAPEIEG